MVGQIIGGLVAIGSSVGSFFIAKKGGDKQDIVQIMEEYVIGYGVGYEQLKNIFPKLYKQNKKYFDEQYKLARIKRDAMEQNATVKFDFQKAKPILIFVVIVLAIYYLVKR